MRQKRKNIGDYIKANPTPGKVVTNMWGRITTRIGTKYYEDIKLVMTKPEFRAFIEDNWSVYMDLFKVWKESGWQMRFSPSLDRIDSTKHYEIGNIELVSTGENSRRSNLQSWRNGVRKLKTHCPRMHVLDEKNTYQDRNHKRHCRTCQRDRARAKRLSQKYINKEDNK